MLKSGAMFGLDARIALAIFGALSVISGAALYSAIQDSKATALLTDMSEIVKAWESYYLDVGQQIPQYGTASDWEKSERLSAELVESSATGWKGPYLPYGLWTGDKRLAYNTDTSIRILYLNNTANWGDALSWTPAGYCNVAGDPCSMWVYIDLKYVNDSLAQALDEKVDGGDGPTTGNFKWIRHVTSTHVFLKGAPVDFSI